MYLVYFAATAYTFENLPPVPDLVETLEGKVLSTEKDIIDGKHLVQRYGLQDYGGILGYTPTSLCHSHTVSTQY